MLLVHRERRLNGSTAFNRPASNMGNQEERMTITTDLVEAYLKCPTKCFLLSREQVETGNAYAEWTRTKSARFRSEGIQRLVTRLAPEKWNTRIPGWQLAIDFKACGNNLQASCHAVERIPSPGRGGPEQFVPCRRREDVKRKCRQTSYQLLTSSSSSTAGNRLGTVQQNIEKDFWVCWTLDALFNGVQAGGPRLLFKGGTSLSEGYGLISCFSEDIDITVFREDIGQAATVEELEALSGKKRAARLDATREACQNYKASLFRRIIIDRADQPNVLRPLPNVTWDNVAGAKSNGAASYPACRESSYLIWTAEFPIWRCLS